MKLNKIIKRVWLWAPISGAFLLIPFILFFNGWLSLLAGSGKESFENKEVGRNAFEQIHIYDISEFYYFVQEGGSSWYGKRFHLRRTSSGETFDMNELTVAHRFLPFGTIVRITNLENGKKLLARVTDRGPFVKSRIVDFSYRTAKEIGALGNPSVKIEALVYDESRFEPSGKYYFGYSFEYPLVCLPEGKVHIFARFTDFDEAVEFYSKFVESHPDVITYLFVPANSPNLSQNSKREYFIGYYPLEKVAPPEYLVREVE